MAEALREPTHMEHDTSGKTLRKARALVSFLDSRGISIDHELALEAVARISGCLDLDTLVKIQRERVLSEPELLKSIDWPAYTFFTPYRNDPWNFNFLPTDGGPTDQVKLDAEGRIQAVGRAVPEGVLVSPDFVITSVHSWLQEGSGLPTHLWFQARVHPRVAAQLHSAEDNGRHWDEEVFL